MKSGYVYCLRFRSTQFYVGSSSNPIQRLQAHRQSCLGKKQINKFMSNVWKKYGEPELYILAKVPLDLLLGEEQKFIDLVFGKEGCLNLNPKADRPPKNNGRPKGSKDKQPRKCWGVSKRGKDKQPRKPYKIKDVSGYKNRRHTAETKAKISEAQLGKKRGPYKTKNKS